MALSKGRNRNSRKKRTAAARQARSSSKRKTDWLSILLMLAAIAAVAAAVYLFTRPNETTTASGLKYIDQVVGAGVSPSPGKTVRVHYTGTLENGVKFDSSVDRGEPYEFVIGTGSVIKGWDEGVMSMKVGGKRKLIVPPSLGYGPIDKGAIPPNSTLLFDVELLDVKN